MRRLSLFAILALLVLAAIGAGLWYVNQTVLPQHAVPLLVQGLKDLTHRDVLIGDVRYRLFQGFIVTDLSIVDPQSQAPTITVEELHAAPLWIPFLRTRRIVIPTLKLTGARVQLRRLEDGQWDLPAGQTSNIKQSPVLIRKIELADSTVVVEDRFLRPVQTSEFAVERATFTIGLPAEVRFRVRATLAPSNAKLHWWGFYALKGRAFTLHGSIEALPLELLAPYASTSLPVTLHAGALSGLVDLQLNDAGRSFSWRGDIAKARVTYDRMTAQGDLQGHVKYSVASTPQAEPTYHANIKLKDATVEGVPVISRWRNVQADLALAPDRLTIRQWSGTDPELTGTLRGTVTNFAQPELNLTAQADVSLKLVEQWLREAGPSALRAAQLAGRAQADLKITGSLAGGARPILSGTLTLAGNHVTLPQLASPLEQVTGTMAFSQDSLSASALKFHYGATPFTGSLDVSQFAAPVVRLNLISDWFTLDADAIQQEQEWLVRKCTGRWHQSTFQATGTIFAQEPNTASLAGTATLDSQDGAALPEPWQSRLAAWELEGTAHVAWEASGPLRFPGQMYWGARADAPLLVIKGYRLPNAQLAARFANHELLINRLTAQPYSGAAQLAFKANWADALAPFQASVYAQNLQLAEVVQDLPTKKKQIAGLLTGRVDLQGFLPDQSTWSGQGAFQIQNGSLWEIPLLTGIPGLFFPEMRKAQFTEGSGNFTVANRRVSSDNILLVSPAADMAIAGHVGFDQSVDAHITLKLAKFEPAADSEASRVAAAALGILRSVGQATAFRVTGTLSDPKLEKVVVPSRIVEDLLLRVLPE